MRICYVADGTSIHTQRWLNYFARQGHDVHLICWKVMPGYDDGIRIHMLTRFLPKAWPVSKYLSAVLWVFQTRRLVKKLRPDIVDGHYLTVYGFLAACSGFRPLVVTSWGSDVLVQPTQHRLARFAVRLALKRADIIVFLYPISIAHEIVAELGVQPDTIRTILLGVDTVEFAPSRRDESIRRGLGIASSQPVVMSTRTLAPLYDVETLLRAIPLVLEAVPDVQFVIAGTGEQQHYLVGLARDLRVSDNVRFVGRLPRAELPQYLSSADIYVSTSLSDGASNSLLEAMACELAPVVTDIPANRLWIAERNNGFLFPVGDFRALASRIVELLRDSHMREAFGRRNRETVLQRAEEKAEMGKLNTIYHDLVEANSVSG